MSIASKSAVEKAAYWDAVQKRVYQVAGSSWENPVWYRDKWRIYTASYIPGEFAAISYIHDDYDVDDNRCGYAASIEAAKAEIDERFY